MFRTMQSVSFEISGFPAYGFHVGSWYVAFVVEAFPTAGLSHTELRSPASALVYVLDVSINQIRLLSESACSTLGPLCSRFFRAFPRCRVPYSDP